MQTAFFPSYRQARVAFLEAAHAAQAQLSSDTHPLKGYDGEVLALDVAVVGDPAAPKRLLVTSGCHGVEGYCGSGIQIRALRDAVLLAGFRRAGVTLVLAHALNPYGFSYHRRFTQENVDLNRNFHDFTKPLPVNEAYTEVHHLLLPQVWPPDDANQGALQRIMDTRGLKFLQAATSGGQHTFADGLFYGGAAPTWSNLAFRALLRKHLSSASHLGWIDVHTGLGPSGHGERIFPAEIGGLKRAEQWWGSSGRTPLTHAADGSSTSAVLSGTIGHACLDECPQSQKTAIGLEFGTQPLLDVLQALRAEQWLYLHPQADAQTHRKIKQQFRAAFFVDTPQWHASVLAQGLETMGQALVGLSGER